MKALKPGSFGHRGLIGRKVIAKEANWVSAKCAIAAYISYISYVYRYMYRSRGKRGLSRGLSGICYASQWLAVAAH
jgi:hypothetical protein